MWALYAILNLVYYVVVIYGAYLGFKVGGQLKRSAAELKNRGLAVQILSILIAPAGWGYALWLNSQFGGAERKDISNLKTCLIVFAVIFVINLFI